MQIGSGLGSVGRGSEDTKRVQQRFVNVVAKQLSNCQKVGLPEIRAH